MLFSVKVNKLEADSRSNEGGRRSEKETSNVTAQTAPRRERDDPFPVSSVPIAFLPPHKR